MKLNLILMSIVAECKEVGTIDDKPDAPQSPKPPQPFAKPHAPSCNS